ncbi:hypothetical protein [Paenibacillus solani]|uniref:DUF4375 domain-containing protein n=1 Tax=Paenibacillus solani TaxID=1705565 RepID=A0A0M1P6Y4_9BACL|nr:hypothetical protein [Paenibacillus solani]KOR90241.1 hypothetical protein AM231_14590 [Paenibacillus solani]
MLIKIKEEDLKKNNLSWLCIQPMLLSIRGRDLSAKSEMYNLLNEGQQALYLFYAFHNHSNSISEFYWFTTYFMGDLKAWNGVKKGVRFFKGNELLSILEQWEHVISQKNKLADGSWREASPSDLDRDTELLEITEFIYKEYQVLARDFIEDVNEYIRNNKEDFFEIEETS